MLKLEPVLKSYIWGGNKLHELYGRGNGGTVSESWEVSVHPDGASKCGDGTLAEYIAKNPRAVSPRGGEFPILIKYIDAADNLSVQVHPDDAYARREEGDNGKTEIWYIISADEGAGIYCGFKRNTSREEFLAKLADGTVEELLNFIPVAAGDCYLVKAGTVHAIGAGCFICEVQESSNVTYRVYDYNRRDAAGNARPLHIDKAMDVINFGAFRDETGGGGYVRTQGGKMRLLTECEYFRVRELVLDGTFECGSEGSFLAFNAIEGSGVMGGYPFKAGDSFFVPAGERFAAEGKAKIILTDKPY